MANSDQNKQADTDFEDDLDKMLQDTAEQMVGDDAVLDDEDEIDRLLSASGDMDQSEPSETESVDDLVDSLLGDAMTKSTVDPEAEIDEFAEDEVDEFADDPEVASDAAEETPAETLTVEQGVDEFADDDMDMFADELLDAPDMTAVKPEAKTESVKEPEPSAAEENMTEIDEFSEESDEDDFLLADFDISADEEGAATEVEIEAATETEQAPEESSEVEPTVLITPEPTPTPLVATPQAAPTVMDNDQSDRILLLENELADLKSALNNTGNMDQVIKDQKRIGRVAEEATAKVKVLSISALVIGVLALIIGITVVVLNLGVQSDVENVQNTVLDIEDSLAAPVIDTNAQRVDQLQEDFNALAVETSSLESQLTEESAKIAELSTQEISRLRDEITEKLSVLAEQVSALEKKATVVARKPRASKARPVKQTEWVVNLVSFKQRWYTDQKVTEFKKKGIPAEVMPISVKGEEWFRVRVVGFKSKAEAASYALKMKKSLSLSSVWVSGK